MTVGYGAQGQGGSKEMYFYSCFQGTVLVPRLMSQERCKPPSNKSPSPSQETLSFPSTISTENVIVSQISSNFFDTRGQKANTYYLSVGTGAKRNRGSHGVVCGAKKNRRKKKKHLVSFRRHANIWKYVHFAIQISFRCIRVVVVTQSLRLWFHLQ